MRQTLLVLALLVSVTNANAQANGNSAPFEVASVKPTAQPYSGDPPSSPDRFIRRSTTLVQLLGYAHEVEEFQIQGGQDWARHTRFAVEAKAAERPTAEQMRSMVRRLLAERFNLKTHVETKELPRYALVRARDDGRLGEKLRPSVTDCPALIAARGRDHTPPSTDSKSFGRMTPLGAPPRCAVTARMTADSVAVFREGIPISDFARSLWSRAGRVIVDKTGLTGTYDIELETERQTPAGLPILSGGSATPRDGLSLFTALQEQLGLKLESERGPVDVLVIDSVELPTPD